MTRLLVLPQLVQLVASLSPGIRQLGEVGLGVGKHVFSIYPASAIAQSQLAIALRLRAVAGAARSACLRGAGQAGPARQAVAIPTGRRTGEVIIIILIKLNYRFYSVGSNVSSS